ncbi:MAG: hypothetical protein M1482_12740 [Chloroflexi bacterium]|nr:hypothetical protein [Chloroflexota bacterium]
MSSPKYTRTTSTRKDTSAIKALIMLSSLGATLGGWGILAAGQVQSTTTNVNASSIPAAVSDQTTSIGTSQQALQQSVAPSVQFRSFARTRSSR